MKKEIIPIVDWKQQDSEKNVHWGDFPMMNFFTHKRLKNNCDYYYSDWNEYINKSMNYDCSHSFK